MGRPEPYVLFAQTFVHSQLDEYVDEVIFSEPIVITACEFLEQNASSASPTVTLMGATSPPSFALEAFVHCEGETRFRRLCQPFLYSHSSSNVLEVEAVVTNHLVVRGTYRSLSLVIYGNTAEDLGQFNIEVDLDSSLTNTVCATEGNLEDLPPALHPTSLAIEESISPLKALSLKVVSSDISVEMKQFLQLTLKIMELSKSSVGDAINTVVNSVVSAASTYAAHCSTISKLKSCGDFSFDLTEARAELLDIYNSFQPDPTNSSTEILYLDSEADLATSKQLVDSLIHYFHFDNDFGNVGHPQLSQSKNVMLWLGAALLLCSARESCFHFVNGGGMKQLGYIFCHGTLNSSAVILMLLGVVEQATRHSVGCEGFLGWWPREDENIPSGTSEGYNQLLKLLLQKQRHDVASLATYILSRMRFYEVASKYEVAVLSALGGLSAIGKVTSVTLDMLTSAKRQLKMLLKIISSRGPIEDPSPVACASRSLILGETDGHLSYKSTSSLITSSNSCFSSWDIDSNLLFLLKERGFLPLSAALLASSILRSEAGHAMDLLIDITSYIEAIILSLLFCRSGLVFLLLDPELSSTVILTLRGADRKKEESVPLRYASVLISKGFFCLPREVGVIVETHLLAVNAIDRLITSKLHSEEILWSLWELCCLSRSVCGRQALLAIGHFPEAVSVLMAALHSVKELDPVSNCSGASPLNLAIFHSAVEIFEVLVTDSTASSLGSWIEHAKELHSALHSSSPGSNRKDAPTRLLEWIDASLVYHKNGAVGLLRYAAVLASGGDAHITSLNILASDAMDVENVVGDASSSSDGNVIDNLLGKPINESRFPGVTLRDSSVAQLTTAFRILAFISDNSVVAAALYDEGAIMVIHAVLIDCRVMLERSSNNYDYLVDEGTECNSTSDLLLERNREQSLVDLLIPSLLLLIHLLRRLQEAKEQHRNTKLLKSLLQLHREVSPKLAACATELSYPYPDFAIGFEAVCHLLVSALACWPIYGWTPGLFHFLLDSLHATSLLALGPKETCSLLFLLNDLLPEEGVWLWKNGIPTLSALRKLAVGTLIGPQKEREINWYLQAGYTEKLLAQLTPQLGKIAHIILDCAISTLVVIQDMLRVFIVRIACLRADSASLLLQPMILWICDRLSDLHSLSDTDSYKVYRLLDFLSILLDHPRAKPLLLKEGAVPMLSKVLESCIGATNSDAKQFSESRNTAKYGFSRLTWCIPVFKSISLLCASKTSLQYPGMSDGYKKKLTVEDCALFLSYILKLSKLLPVGRELLSCLSAFEELSLTVEGRNALLSIFLNFQSSGIEDSESESRHEVDVNYNLTSNTFEWKKQPPLLSCWITLLRSINSEDVPLLYTIEAVGALTSGALHFCMDGKGLNLDRVAAMKYLFGLPYDMSDTDDFSEENIKYIQDLTTLVGSRISDNEYSAAMNRSLYQVKVSANSLLLLLHKPDDMISSVVSSSSSSEVSVSSKIKKIADGSANRVEDYSITEFGDKFLWECPENLRERFSQTALPVKRKIPALEGSNRRPRGDNGPPDSMAQSVFSRGSGPSITPSGPSRRDTFRQRKPNTSRPPSMHVDDYVARERNVDGTTSSNVIAVPRVGPTSGRPPSIHVDEFMARQRERQNQIPMGPTISEAKTSRPENDTDVGKSKTLKPDLDDDLQGIDIVFDGEESESDDKLPFPQPDDNLQQPASVIVDQNSPRSIVEETESDVNESSHYSHPLPSNVDENIPSEFSSRVSVSRQEVNLAREPSISSDKKYPEQSDDPKNVPVYNKNSGPSVQLPVDSRMAPPNFYPKNSVQHTGGVPMAVGSQGFFDQKFQLTQPPLPPMPPPPTISPVLSQAPDPVQSQPSPYANSMPDGQPPLPTGFHDSMYSRTPISSPGGSTRPPPPLPPTPPPYSVLPSMKTSTSQSSVYNQTSSTDSRFISYPPQSLMPPLLFNRPLGFQGENSSSISLHSLGQLQPLQPPQLPRPPQPPPQHLRPPIPVSPQSDHSMPMMQPLPMLQPPQVSPAHHVYYQTIQQESFSHTVQQQPQQQPQQQQSFENTQTQALQQQGGQGTSQQQEDAGMSLQDYFSSPEAIQSLLSDRDKLCQLLEQHPKLMQMLQQKLGQL